MPEAGWHRMVSNRSVCEGTNGLVTSRLAGIRGKVLSFTSKVVTCGGCPGSWSPAPA